MCLKIIQVITSPTGGGAEVLVRAIGEQVQVTSYDSEVLYFNANSIGSSNFNANKNETVLGVKSRSPKAILELRKEFKKRLNNNHQVVIHAHLTWAFYYVAIASIGLNMKLIYTEHNTTNKRRKIPFFQYIERLFYGRYEKIICISQGTKKSLDTWIGKKLSSRTLVVQNGSRIYSFYHRKSNTGTLNFISIGSLTYKKGFETAIKALSLLENKNWKYKIIGEGPERKSLENLIGKLKLKSNIELLGWSNNIESYLHNADIQLIPSLWEGFGLVAVEGMSTGLPVVASNVDGLREVLDETNPAVFLVNEYRNSEEFSRKIEECVKKRSINLEEISIQSRRQAEKFKMDTMIEKYIEIYKSMF
ncbi:glycosyltransferase [Aliarcobacter skirrowii]|uniref:glycosyltransferase n=1 Tax=Aliarcobacter skirrowii TaxID=28200 RepID=UPI00082ABA00|nr:glycosyltransferase [Aliarcobacter skirrowii]